MNALATKPLTTTAATLEDRLSEIEAAREALVAAGRQRLEQRMVQYVEHRFAQIIDDMLAEREKE